MIDVRRLRAVACTLIATTLLTACSVVTDTGTSPPEPIEGQTPAKVVLVTHDSFALPKKLIRAWEADTGFDLVQRSSGDAGTLTNKLVLTQGKPIGDVAYGIDDSFAARALDADVFTSAGIELPAGLDRFAVSDGEDRLVPVDTASVCVNIDKSWFRQQRLAPPKTLEDLTDPRYRDLMVAPSAPSSSPGMAFLLSTIAAYGDDWPTYWRDLLDNGLKLTNGWSDAYFVDFTAGGGDNPTRPIVVSYDSSPAFTLTDDGGATTTKALLDTCYRQVEYAGILAGADNPAGAAAVVELLVSADVQAALPTSMFVFPVRDGVGLPPQWARFASRPSSPASLDPAEVAANRDEWLRTWTDLATG